MIDGVSEENEVQEAYHRCSEGEAQVNSFAPARKSIYAEHSGKPPRLHRTRATPGKQGMGWDGQRAAKIGDTL